MNIFPHWVVVRQTCVCNGIGLGQKRINYLAGRKGGESWNYVGCDNVT